MKLMYFSENTLIIIKNNISLNLIDYSDPNSNFFKELINDKSKLLESNIEFEEINLIPDVKKEYENIKELYSKLKHLTDLQASDERVWAGLAHSHLRSYMIKRWSYKEKKDKVQFIRKSFFFGHSQARSLMTNGLARLWWIGRLTYDNNNQNPFHLTDFFSSDINGLSFQFFGTNFSRNFEIVRKIIESLYKFQNKHRLRITRDVFSKLVVEINLLGSKYLLDTVDELKMQDLIELKLLEILKE